jgi:hypothetical protein
LEALEQSRELLQGAIRLIEDVTLIKQTRLRDPRLGRVAVVINDQYAHLDPTALSQQPIASTRD